MSDVVPPDSINWSRLLKFPTLPPLSVASVVRLFVHAAVVGLPVLLRKTIVLLRLANWIPATVEEAQHQPGRKLIPPIPGVPDVIILYEQQLPAAVRAIRNKVVPPIPPSEQQERYFDSDSGNSSDASRSCRSDVKSYPSLHLLDVRDVTLVVPDSIARLDHMLRSLPEAEHLEAIRTVCSRYSDVLEMELLMDNVHSDSLSNPYALNDKFSENCVIWLRSTAIVCRLLWNQLEEQNQQSYQEQKYCCFAGIADQSMNNLLKFASSFSLARWPADRATPIFDTLVEVLNHMKDLPFSRSDAIQIKVAGIYRDIVNSMEVIIEEIANDGHINKESDIHPATECLLKALKLFHYMEDMLEAVPGAGDYANRLLDCWVLKLKKVARRLFENREDQQYIFILNNAWFVSQRGSDPNMSPYIQQVESRVGSLIERDLRTFLDKFWIPLLTNSTMDKFTRDFGKICSDGKRILKVRPGLREKLIGKIVEIGLGPNGPFLRFNQNGQQLGRSGAHRFLRSMWKKEKSMTAAEFEDRVKGRFER